MTEYSEEEKEVMNANRSSFYDRWGALITESGGEQCRGGAYSYPGALDRYEKALGLKPAESWLMKRLLSLDWTGKRYVWCSLRKISEEADVSYNEVLKLMKSLERKGYVRDMGQHGSGAFSQVRDWSIAGLLCALEYAIKCDPSTVAGKAHANALGHKVTMADFWVHAEGPDKDKPYAPFKPFTTPKQLYEYMNSRGSIPGFDPVYGGSVSIPLPEKKPLREHVCSECGKSFKTGSRNPATRCTTCRKKIKRQSLKPLVLA